MNNYDDFLKRFNIKHVRVMRDRDYTNSINYGSYNQTASYFADREELIEMELSRSGFDQLVDLDRKYDNIWEEQRDEAWMRRTYPAVAEAYSKYQMLLELYK